MGNRVHAPVKVLYLDHADILGGAEGVLLDLLCWAEGIQPWSSVCPTAL